MNCPKAPIGFHFGKEVTIMDIQYRIQWESWAYNLAMKGNNHATATGHALAKQAYIDKLRNRIHERIQEFMS